MRVLYDYQIFNEQKFGGISRYISFLSKHIKKLGVKSKIGVIFSNNDYLKEENVGKQFFPERWFPKKLAIMRYFNSQYSLYLLKSGKFDLLHASYYEDYYFKKSAIPVVVTVYDMIHEKLCNDYKELRDDNFIKKKKDALINADLIISISENTRKDVLELYPFIKPEKIKTVHLCLMIEDKKDNYEIVENNRQRPYYLFVGSRIMYKNFDLLIDAFSLLTNPEYDVILAGGGAVTQEDLAKMKSKGVDKYFFQQNIKNDDELNSLYKNALSYISTSAYEGFGLPVLEAFSNNCAVLLSDNPCYREIAADGAEYFSLSNPQELADLLQKVFKATDFRNNLKEKGTERLKFFNKEKLIDETIACYKTLKKDN